MGGLPFLSHYRGRIDCEGGGHRGGNRREGGKDEGEAVVCGQNKLINKKQKLIK